MNDAPGTKGVIFNIQHYSIHDGPGIRTTVFLKGCPLRCLTCQNPESQTIQPELFFNAGRCQGCGLCVEVCPEQAIDIFEGRADYPTSSGPCNGYTLLSSLADEVLKGEAALLVDMKGNVVQRWRLINHPVKMLPGGSVIGTKNLRPLSTGMVLEAIVLQQLDWDSKQEWAFSGWDADGTSTMMSRQHHDFEREGNPVGYYAPGQDFRAQGRTLVLAHKNVQAPKVSSFTLLDDPIYEVDWSGKLTGFVWYPSDHLDEMGFQQDALDAIKKNPNYNPDIKAGDWLHINSVSTLGKNRWYQQYNDQRFHPDNIIIDSREANFIAIISRQTGKIVWRVGPEYGKGTPGEDIGQLVGPHHAHIIPHGLPGAGNILVYDNGGQAGYGGPKGHPRHERPYSRVVEFNPMTLKVVWEYGEASGPESFFSGFVSAAQRLPNGNTLITVGDACKVFEVNLARQRVWSYVEPKLGQIPMCSIYRAYRIPPEWLPSGENAANYPEWRKTYPVY